MGRALAVFQKGKMALREKSTESPVTRLKTQNLDCAAVRTLQRQEAENVS